MAPLKPSFDGALELVGGAGGIAGRQRREGREAVRPGGHHGGQPIVHPLRQRDGAVAGQLLGRGRAVGEHLDVDAGLVHLLEAPLAELEHAVHDRGIGLDLAEMLDQLVVVIVLLDRDDRTFGLLQHV